MRILTILSGGPILEPMIGFTVSAVLCLILLAIFIKRTFKSSYYKFEFIHLNIIIKIVYILIFCAISLSLLFVLFYIFAFLIDALILNLN